MSNISVVDVTIVTAYIITCILAGLYRYKSVKTLKEYALGISSLPSIVIVTTLFMTATDATQVIGCITEVYMLGMWFAIVCLLSPITWLVMSAIYSKSIEQFRGCISLSDIMEILYGKVGRWVTNVTSLLVSIGVIVMQCTAIVCLISDFFGISYLCSSIISASVLCIYSIFGGVRAVALNDVFQFAIIIVALPIAFSFAYHDIGGYRGIVNSLPSVMIPLNIDNVFLLLSFIFYAFLPNTEGVDIQRVLMCRNSIQLTYCMNVAAVVAICFSIVLCMIGFILKIKLPDMDTNTVLIHFITNHVSVGFKGLIIAGLLAIAMSTADSHINYASVLCTHDIVRKMVNITEKQALLIARMFTLFICILSTFLTTNTERLFTIELFIMNFWDPLIIVPLIIGFLKFKTNSKSFITALTAAVLFTSISGYIVGRLGTISLVFGMLGSAAGLFGMHYWQVYQSTLNSSTKSNIDTILRVKQ